jgi:hypothetical protein
MLTRGWLSRTGVAALSVLVSLFFTGVTWAVCPQPALAAAAPSSQDSHHYTHSWYIKDLSGAGARGASSALYTLGYQDGLWDAANCTDGWSVLDFGQVGTYNGAYGTFDFAPHHPFVANATIVAAAEDYAKGWSEGATAWDRSGRTRSTGGGDDASSSGACPHLILAMGTNNYVECPYAPCSVYAAGQQWLNVVNALQQFLASETIAGQIQAAGASDMETTWDSAARTRLFVDGFNANNTAGYMLFDYGDARRTRTWSDADIYYVAAGAPHTAALPEIYSANPDAAARWSEVQQEYPSFVFLGTMTECRDSYALDLSQQTCASPANEYAPDASRRALEMQIGQTALQYTTNIKYQGMQ